VFNAGAVAVMATAFVLLSGISGCRYPVLCNKTTFFIYFIAKAIGK